jgi:hypothetical protein
MVNREIFNCLFSSVCSLGEDSNPGPQFYRGETALCSRCAADRCGKQTSMFCRTG